MSQPVEQMEGLPTFQTPPVVEVVLGVQFDPLPFGAFELGQTYELWRDAYPLVQEHPAIPAASPPGFFIEMNSGPEVRYWFLNEANTRLVQIQKDRIVLNWRAQDGSDPYPRYSVLRREIEQRLGEFLEFARQRDVVVRPIATEVTYINLIGVREYTPFHDVVNFVSKPPILQDTNAESNLQIRYDTTREFEGITSNFVISSRRDTSRLPSPIVLQLSSHAEASGGDILKPLDLSHKLVVTSFRDITTDAMHREWGLT